MLDRQTIRQRLDAIADGILDAPGIYQELYSRLFSLQVKQWAARCNSRDAALIEAVASAECPEYCVDFDDEVIPTRLPPALYAVDTRPLFNPDWDVSY
jgi:hypothetical protein